MIRKQPVCKKQASGGVFFSVSSNSRQNSWQGFSDTFVTGMQNRVQRQGKGPATGFQAAQDCHPVLSQNLSENLFPV